MALQHSNPTRPRIDRDGQEYSARAPYNFVPLPEKMVAAREPIAQDSYDEGLTGWIECELKTCSPTYVRGMLTETKFKLQGSKKPDQLTDEDKAKRAPFFATTEETVEGYPKPVIPGSSLRGMIRTLVEVIGYGRMRWVASEPTFTFRAVAASRDDPLREPYREVIGAFARNVQAGYLEKSGEKWYVHPAIIPKSQGWSEQGAFLKVKEYQIKGKDILNYLRFDSSDYRPQWHEVSFDAANQQGQRGKYTLVANITSRRNNNQSRGVLVCSGNMLETGKGKTKSPRKNHALILEPDDKAQRIEITETAIKDYLAGLTPYQKEQLVDWGGEMGCLKAGAPVFYVTEGDKVAYFGHSPNFRIPARLLGADRAATPSDFVLDGLKTDSRPDLADATFGWVEETQDRKKVSPPGQRAGRVFFGDAHFMEAEEGVWLAPAPITLHVLANPKPTTFQHYLVQDKNAGHNPDDKSSLAHYGTSPQETQIRGYKFYWIKGKTLDIEANFKEREHPKQLTQIIPVKAGVRFTFKIHFESLREEELGALFWALTLPGQPGREYRHRLGMGKPFGMGVVALKPQLVLTNRQKRYESLFSAGNSWHTAAVQTDAQPYVDAFESWLLKTQGVAPDKKHLAEVPRIQTLLTMLAWCEGEADWLDKTRYMEIEHGDNEVNEYKERPVLPTPQGVVSKESSTTSPPAQIQKVTSPPKETPPGGSKFGTVKVFGLGQAKSFGFIQPDEGGSDVFVHLNQVTNAKILRPGQRVSFKVSRGAKGLEARDVRVID